MAMLTIFVFNVLFWMFFEQAGSSFNFLADKIVNRDIGMTALFQAPAPMTSPYRGSSR
jgi:POT family proton-dependent oligopeptide transporter